MKTRRSTAIRMSLDGTGFFGYEVPAYFEHWDMRTIPVETWTRLSAAAVTRALSFYPPDEVEVMLPRRSDLRAAFRGLQKQGQIPNVGIVDPAAMYEEDIAQSS